MYNAIIYDGECGLCNRSVQFILKFERKPTIKFASFQSLFAKNVLKEFGLGSNYDQSILFYKNGRLYSKSRAILKIIPFLKWYLYPLLIIWLVPNFIRNVFYDIIARNRKRISKVCELPGPEHSSRFIS
jgi:predicted DCC family thiol-disulfide oxidoreductase YuxK